MDRSPATLADIPDRTGPEPIGPYRIGHYPTHLITQRLLGRGVAATLRPALPQDALPLADLFARLAPEERRQRFFGALRLSQGRLVRMLGADPDHDLALLVTVQEGGDETVIAEGRYVVAASGEVAEFALAVDPAWARQGIGTWLMASLCEAAAQVGVRRLRGDVLAGNEAMAALMRRCRFALWPDARHGWLMHAECDLADAARHAPRPPARMAPQWLVRWLGAAAAAAQRWSVAAAGCRTPAFTAAIGPLFRSAEMGRRA